MIEHFSLLNQMVHIITIWLQGTNESDSGNNRASINNKRYVKQL
jgi:hypothetical protein